jgi:tripartite-type tricarboxylate transporter receptor subunit TctC
MVTATAWCGSIEQSEQSSATIWDRPVGWAGKPNTSSVSTAAAMEDALKRVYDCQAYKEYSHRNMFDSGYLDPAGFGKYLAANRVVQEEFLRAIGVVK